MTNPPPPPNTRLWWKTRCPTCRTIGFNSVWTNGEGFSFSCKCGTAIVGALDQMPDSLKEIAPTTALPPRPMPADAPA